VRHLSRSSPRTSIILKLAVTSEQFLTLVAQIPLLREFFVCRIDAIADLKGSQIRDYVYSRITTAAHTSKQTAAGRFDEITASLVIEDDLNLIHDIAVSSGATSLELYRVLERRGVRMRFHISDKYAKYGSTGRALSRIVDADQNTVEMYVCGVLAKRSLTSYFFFSRFLYWLLAGVDAHRPIKWFVLLDPAIMDYIARGLIHQIEYDVFETRMPDSFTFVRCMNLLNLDYFAPDRIIDALHNVVESLREGGVLQIGVSPPPIFLDIDPRRSEIARTCVTRSRRA
jgi:hypothetical protein